jgi:Holliday junction resolvasome RuvABC ATP-dependent DNA helicase subunit
LINLLKTATITTPMFDTLIGQSGVKTRLTFYSDAKKSRGVIPPLMFNGAKGLGKTEFAKQFAKVVGNPLMELNCSTIKNEEQFVDQIFIPYILDKEVTILFDECHALPKRLMELFLTAFNTDNKKKKTVSFRDYSLDFDFQKQTYLFATTDMQKVIGPFKDRMNEINFAPYSYQELGEIIKKRLDYVTFEDDVMVQIGQTLRGNARSAVKRAVEIEMYCENHNKNSFGLKDWASLCKTLEILPFGLTVLEKQVLTILRERGACSLQMLAAVTGMERQAIQREVEVHLLREGFMRIDGKREITGRGNKVLELIANM